MMIKIKMFFNQSNEKDVKIRKVAKKLVAIKL